MQSRNKANLVNKCREAKEVYFIRHGRAVHNDYASMFTTFEGISFYIFREGK